MFACRDDEKHLFDRVEKEIADNGRSLIHSLNNNWKTLGVDDNTRLKRTEELIKIVQERYDEVLEETLEKIRIIKHEIDNLHKEAINLSECLSIDIETTLPESNAPLCYVKETLEKDLERYRYLLIARKERIEHLNDWQKNLSHLLGCVSKTLEESPLPSEETLDDLENYLKAQQEEYDKRIQIFLKKQESIKRLLNELEDVPLDSFLHYVCKSSYQDFRVIDQNMTKLTSVNEMLMEKLDQRQTEVLEMRERLALLWERLEESPTYRASFLSDFPGHSRATKTALTEELQRCEEKKRQSFKLFVNKVRSEIVDMWEKCFYSDVQREKFSEFYVHIYNEDLLMLHEMQLEELKEFYKENKDIFEMYAVRQQLWTKWSELEARANEPGRFHNRGGQLLREEKERKALSNQLPKIEAELTQLVELYESRSGKTFTVNGISLLQMMQNDVNQKNLERQNKLSARKQHLGVPAPMSCPRTAPSTRQAPLITSRVALTAVKRRLSPRQSPQVSKSRLLPRRLHLTPSTPTTIVEAAEPKRFKGTVPNIAVNGYVIKKKKVVGRLSQESNKKRKIRKSQGSSSATSRVENDKDVPETSISSYSDFQEHLNEKVTSRSSVVPGRTLRSRGFKPEVSSSAYMPNGLLTPNKLVYTSHTPQKNDKIKENLSPFGMQGKVTPKAQLYASNTFGATPMANRSNHHTFKTPEPKSKRNIDGFATPRPVGKSLRSGVLCRQNTITLASPSPNMEKTRPMLRSSSSHNLRANALSPSYPLQSPKLQLTSKLPLII